MGMAEKRTGQIRQGIMTGETIGYSPSTPALSLTTKPKPFRPGTLENPSQTGPEPARNPIETTQHGKRKPNLSYPFACFTWRLCLLCFALWRCGKPSQDRSKGTGTETGNLAEISGPKTGTMRERSGKGQDWGGKRNVWRGFLRGFLRGKREEKSGNPSLLSPHLPFFRFIRKNPLHFPQELVSRKSFSAILSKKIILSSKKPDISP